MSRVRGPGLRPEAHTEGLPALLGALSLSYCSIGLSVEHSANAPESFWLDAELWRLQQD